MFTVLVVLIVGAAVLQSGVFTTNSAAGAGGRDRVRLARRAASGFGSARVRASRVRPRPARPRAVR